MLRDKFLRMLVFYSIVVKMPLNLRQKINGSAKTPSALLTCSLLRKLGFGAGATLPTAGGSLGALGMRAVLAKGSLH